MPRHTFRDLATVVDDVHALVDGWAAGGTLAPGLDADGVEVLRLVVHEWVANLVQHATFHGAVEITLGVRPMANGAACEIEDNSAGFDFATQIAHQQAVLDAPGPSERGRGLLMLVTCTQQLSFAPARGGRRQRIAFHVHPADAMPLLAGLFSSDDLGSDDFADAPLGDAPGDGPPPDPADAPGAFSLLPPGGDGAAPHPSPTPR